VYLRRTRKIAPAQVPSKILSSRSVVLCAILAALAVMLWFALRRDVAHVQRHARVPARSRPVNNW
jgi:hypothetical protein